MLQGINILVAEDNVINQKVVNFLLSKNGATVTTVSNGVDAVDQVRDHNFDMVLMDLYMPQMDGYAATEHIRKELKINVPIVGFTAGGFAGEKEKCLAVGMNDCVVKGDDPVRLCNMILSMVNEHVV